MKIFRNRDKSARKPASAKSCGRITKQTLVKNGSSKFNLVGKQLDKVAPNTQLNLFDHQKLSKATTTVDTKVNDLVEDIPKGEVLVSLVPVPNEKDEEKEVPLCFCEYDGKEYMFAPQSVLMEARKCLEAVGKEGKKMKLLVVEDVNVWVKLIQKAGPGIAGKKSNVPSGRLLWYFRPKSERYGEFAGYDGGIETLFRYSDNPCPWSRLCCKSWMLDAINEIPRQSDDPYHEGWSCGVNSAAKAIHLFGKSMSTAYYRNTFMPHAPRDITRSTMNKTGQRMGVGGAVTFGTGLLLAPFTGGASIPVALTGWGVSAAGAATQVVGEALPTDSGVRPTKLAKHISNYLSSGYASCCSRDDFWECARVIRDDVRRGDPVIVLWVYRVTAAHYVNVVAVSVDSNDEPEDFVIMDTNNCLYRYTWQEMKYLMKREFAIWAAILQSTDDYHFIRFYK